MISDRRAKEEVYKYIMCVSQEKIWMLKIPVSPNGCKEGREERDHTGNLEASTQVLEKWVQHERGGWEVHLGVALIIYSFSYSSTYYSPFLW